MLIYFVEVDIVVMIVAVVDIKFIEYYGKKLFKRLFFSLLFLILVLDIVVELGKLK